MNTRNQICSRNVCHVLVIVGLSLNLSLVKGQSIEGKSNPVLVTVNKGNSPMGESITLEMLGITKIPTYHALIIGVSNYKYSGPGLDNLEMPVNDAQKLYDLLTMKYSFDPQNVTLLKNPTREDIINQFDALAEKVIDKDNLLIFYAGHGYYDKAKDFGFWLPSDAKKTSRSAWIANSTIKDYVGAIKTKHTLLITDACFGGSIFKTRSVETMIQRFNEVYKLKSRKALTSGNLTEVPDKSVFLRYLLKTLEDNKEVLLPTSTLYNRIYEPILNNSSTIPQWGVIQSAGDEGGDFVFIKSK